MMKAIPQTQITQRVNKRKFINATTLTLSAISLLHQG